MAKPILLQKGIALTHDKDDHVVPLYDTDVLICDSIITAVGKDLQATLNREADILDCRGKIVSPGYIDTHHHLWQTQLKGRHAEEGLVAYMVTGNMMSYAYSPSDIYWGQLSGCLEALNAGTTTVLDHSHAGYTPEHVYAAIEATTHSGIRSIFAYAIPVRMSKWDQSCCTVSEELIPEWAFPQIEELASTFNSSALSHRVEIGFGFDWWFLLKEVCLGIFRSLRKSGIRLITSHVGRTGFQGMQTDVSKMESYGVLRAPYHPLEKRPELPFFVLSHCNGYTNAELSILCKTGTSISSTPETESQMGIGYPVALHPCLNGAQPAKVGLGIDCHSIVPSNLLLQARTLLLLARLEPNSHITATGKFPTWNVRNTSEDVFNIATIRGARSLGLDKDIGSIEIGKKADIVIFDTAKSVSMLSAVEYDHLVAIIRFSEAADIETVIVDVIIRKQGGKLVDVETRNSDGSFTPWQDVARRVKQSQEGIQGRINKLNIKKGKEALFETFRTDEATLVDATI